MSETQSNLVREWSAEVRVYEAGDGNAPVRDNLAGRARVLITSNGLPSIDWMIDVPWEPGRDLDQVEIIALYIAQANLIHAAVRVGEEREA